MSTTGPAPARPVQVRGAKAVAVERLGEYVRLVVLAPPLAAAAPGQFVAVSAGGEGSAFVLQRAFSIHDVDPAAGTVSVVVAAHGAGTRWICGRRPGDLLDVVGPLGHGFSAPAPGERLVLVGGGYGSAPFAWSARVALAAGAQGEAVVGAGDAARLCDVDGITRVLGASAVHVCTEDGSAGRRGRVTDLLSDLLRAAPGSDATARRGDLPAATGRRGGQGADATARSVDGVRVAACGPMAMLRAVADTVWAAPEGAVPVVVEVAVEEAMACGIGVCMTCVLPVLGDDGATRMTRACTAGPVLRAERIRWDAVHPGGASVPADAVGAPAGGAL